MAAPSSVEDNMMFVAGPAIDILPTRCLSAGPWISTAPGEMILKIIGMTDINVSAAPMSVNLNSAQYPSFWATSL